MKAYLIEIKSKNGDYKLMKLVYASNFTRAVLKIREIYIESEHTFHNLTVE